MEAPAPVESAASLKTATAVEAASLETTATEATRAVKAAASAAREVQRPLIEGLTLEGYALIGRCAWKAQWTTWCVPRLPARRSCRELRPVPE